MWHQDLSCVCYTSKCSDDKSLQYYSLMTLFSISHIWPQGCSFHLGFTFHSAATQSIPDTHMVASPYFPEYCWFLLLFIVWETSPNNQTSTCSPFKGFQGALWIPLVYQMNQVTYLFCFRAISPCYPLKLCIQIGIFFLFSFAFHFSSFHSYL